MNGEKVLEINGLEVGYGNGPVVMDVTLSLARGAIGCLLGPSGCGKTTILRTVAGFERAQDGSIVLRGRTVEGGGVSLPAEERSVGMVFQDFALFPHLTVAGNVGFGLARVPARERQARVEALLARVGLQGLSGAYPHELSGGQQQRVALARALAPRPDLLLLDEPFSSLDVVLRESLVREVRGIIKATGATALVVTHNQHEAFALADEIGVMDGGKLLQWGTAQDLYHRPRDRSVAAFIGEGSALRGRVLEPGAVQTALGTLAGPSVHPAPAGQEVDVLVRPEDVVHDDASPFRARIAEKAYRGPHILYTLELDSGERVLSLVSSHHDHPTGTRLGIRTELEELVMWGRGV